MKEAFKRLLISMKFWTTIIGGLATAGASWFAKYGLALSDATVQHIAITVSGLFAILLYGQAQTDQGKEAKKLKRMEFDRTLLEGKVLLPPANTNVKEAPAVKEAGFVRLDTVFLILFISAVLVGVFGSACSWIKSTGSTVKDNIVDCTKAVAKQELVQFTPMVRQVIIRATDGEGHIDWPSVEDATFALKADAFCIVMSTVEDLLAQALDPNAPSADVVVLDKASTEAGITAIKNKRYPGVEFK